MSGRKRKEAYVAAAQARAKLRGWWGMACGLTMAAIGFVLEFYFIVILVDWHNQLAHAGRVDYPGRPIELWELILIPSLLPFMAAGGLLLNCVIWLIPPLRRLSEKPAKISPSLGFAPMQKGLFQALIWTWWTIPLGVGAAWLAP